MRARVWLILIFALAAVVGAGTPALGSSAVASDPPTATLHSACSQATGEWSVGWQVKGGSTTQQIVATHGTGESAYVGILEAGSSVRTTGLILPSGTTTTALSIRYWDAGSDGSQSQTVTKSATLNPCLAYTHDSDPVAYFQHYCGWQIGAYMENRVGATSVAEFTIRGPSGWQPWSVSYQIPPGQHRWHYITAPFWGSGAEGYEIFEDGVRLAATYSWNQLDCPFGEQPICPCANIGLPPGSDPGQGDGGGGGTGTGIGSTTGTGPRPGAGSASQPATPSSTASGTTPAVPGPGQSSGAIPTQVTRAPTPTAAALAPSSRVSVGWAIGLGTGVLMLAGALVALILFQRHRAVAIATSGPDGSDPTV